MESTEQLICNLRYPERRERAMYLLCQQLSKQMRTFQDLAPLLWHSFGSIAILLQEILSIYHHLSPPTVSTNTSNRVCNALVLFQSVASHPETRVLLMRANLHVYVYPFLSTKIRTEPFENLRAASLGVICTLLKVDDRETISHLLETPVVPQCLFAMDFGSEISQARATFVLQKILMDDCGLQYICTTAERIQALGSALWRMVASHSGKPSRPLLKCVIHCFIRLLDHSRGLMILENVLPQMLKDAKFSGCLHDDPETGRWLQELMYRVGLAAYPVNRIYHT